ncbi:bifunctional 2-polyprenyl-6-hydroxyphenol methylase/3-demethylubiquinol 3-O-methyltransferase UbiG [Pseudomarimonas arenosa]|uniref:Ubiquinone biosynthesis O-methyltransferase n=1 Tax=Pseudomarimonas arenosa TaxID=2774145 RepID=A0AAW3ZJZ4_9GAMM|nr:bifunctional 2-polyprenyl-6-hydroxyphenol methylase/3-demethylubiquinol 3-O-methyltransferase UbiG [Pseudomarimonas arenosa]
MAGAHCRAADTWSHGVSGVATNASASEIAKFDRLAARWWDPHGESRPLHELNPARLGFVSDRTALRGKRVLDVGCGGGLLSEALNGAGAEVVAIDLAEELIEIARLHLLESGRAVDYRLCSAEQLAAAEPASFDVITCMEMLEHVPDPASVISAMAALLKPGGQLFLSTLNRTPLAFAGAIVGAEYLLRLLPRGTHQYKSFIKPSELAAGLRDAGLQLKDVAGLHYVPLLGKAFVGPGTGVNYLAWAERPL